MTDSIIVDTATRIFADLCEPGTVNAAEAGTPSVALVAADGLAISQGTSLAGEPRDTVSFDGATAIAAAPATALDTLGLVQLGAAARAQQMAGALEHILEQSVQFSLDRV